MLIFFATSKIIVYLHCEYNIYVNMSVYLLFEDVKFSKTKVLGVFSSREKAYSVMRDLYDDKPAGSTFYVCEYGVDDFLNFYYG